MTNNSVFIKKSELKRTENKIKKSDIHNMIPTNSSKKKDPKKKLNMIEFRWKIYDIEEIGTYVEISKKYPEKKRIFLDKYGKWIETCIDKKYSVYCIEKYYYYTDK